MNVFLITYSLVYSFIKKSISYYNINIHVLSTKHKLPLPIILLKDYEKVSVRIIIYVFQAIIKTKFQSIDEVYLFVSVFLKTSFHDA